MIREHKGPSTREIAFLVIRDTFGNPPRAAQAAFDYRIARAGFDERDRAFTAELTYGTIKMRRLLDWYVRPLIGERYATLPPAILDALRLGAYQLLVMDGVAVHAAVHESVSVAMRHGHRGTAGLVNAVLRRIDREKPPAPEPSAFDSYADYVGTVQSLPTWIVERMSVRISDSAELLARAGALNVRPQQAMRVDVGTRSAAEIIEAFLAHNYHVRPSEFAADSFILTETMQISDGERAGLGTAQSESSALPVDLLAPQAGERVLEFCAGRGNKTLQIAARTGGAELTAVELDERKASALTERLAAAGRIAVRVVCADALHWDETETYNAVLVDAPCSGLGILGRHPEARWRKLPSDAARLAGVQRDLLEAAATRTAPGGRVVYSVCSIDRTEGEEVVAGFLAAHPDWTRSPLPERYAPLATSEGDVVVLPGAEGRDGFFISCLARP